MHGSVSTNQSEVGRRALSEVGGCSSVGFGLGAAIDLGSIVRVWFWCLGLALLFWTRFLLSVLFDV